jgi:hypothetical protein
MRAKFLFLCFLLSSPMFLIAQFEQKVTINVAGTFVVPELNVDEDNYVYDYGVGLEGGLQYNFNRRVSLIGNVRFYYMDGIDGNVYTDNIAVGLGLKLNMAPSRRINPYFFGEANLNFLWYSEYIMQDNQGVGQDIYNNDFGTSIGGNGGLGIDFRLGDNFSLFLQTSIYYVYYDGLLNNLTQAGVRISMFKSKTI